MKTKSADHTSSRRRIIKQATALGAVIAGAPWLTRYAHAQSFKSGA